MNNILYLTKAYPIREYKISEYIKKEIDCNIYAVSFSRRFSKEIISFNNKEKVFNDIFDYTEWVINNKEKKLDLDFLNFKLFELENKYKIPSLNLAITADRFLKNKDELFIKKNIYNCFLFFEKIILNNNIDIIIGEISSLTDYIIYYMAKENQIKYIFPWHARKKNHIVFSDIKDDWSGLKKIYNMLKRRDLTFDEKKEIQNYIDNYIQNKTQPDYMKYNKKNGFKVTNIVEYNFLYKFKRILTSYFTDIKYGIDYDHSLTKKLKNRLNILKKKIINFNKLFSELNINSDKYFLVPLHYQPEASTMTLAPFYLNPLDFIKNLSKVIPIDSYLYVKEHPNMIGRRRKDFYYDLKKNHNVKLVNSNLDVHNLIKKSIGVITITNTTGYEAIIHDKPVFTFGNVFYNLYDYCMKIDNYNELLYKIKKVQNSWESNNNERNVNRYKFIKAVNGSMYKGNFNNHMKDASVLSSENLKNIAESIIQYIS